MELPNGVTGFYEGSNEPPKMDSKQLKSLCFNYFKTNGGKILEVWEPRECTNFFDIKVNLRDKSFHILLNEHYPLLAFASDVKIGQINFIDKPSLGELFSGFYNVLKAEDLDNKLFEDQNNNLNRAELEQIKYWKPQRIGDVIFNFWD
ncbi:hypothetical protein [Mesobacillus selenatarsenatis]|uniref:Uncharacterized protein n=1 Tax=Mesobacillus selenatarsenatis TaxID=388741 RepID=A0A846TCW7_9BACI|nr:hypothetical protein [Mesobacillus selenatarsenatis]NKE04659.1 hypothetical protein [Mesobacillus selenatarsenatis]